MTSHWDLMRELATMQDRMNRLWGTVQDRGDEVTSRGGWQPPVDIFETHDKEVVVKAELPGLTREDIDLTVENTTLTIRAERRRDDSVPADRYHRSERIFGTCSRSFTLPNTIDGSRVKAEYRDGVLTIRLPVREEARPRQIQVEVAG
jgi:HSP20 family protein